MGRRIVVELVFWGCACLASGAWADTVGYWRFEEGLAGAHPTTVLDSSDGGHHGDARNFADSGTYQSDTSPLAPGFRSLDFNGENDFGDYIVVAPHSDLDLSENFTLEAFIKPDPTDRAGLIVGRREAADSQYMLFIDEDGSLERLGFGSRDIDPDEVVTPPLSLDDGWHHVAATVAARAGGGLTIRLYVDYEEQYWQDVTGSIGSYPVPVTIGAQKQRSDDNYKTDFEFKGLIDEVRISNQVLTPSEFFRVPEPATIFLLATGLFLASRRRSA